MTESGAAATLQLALALWSMPSQRILLRRWPLPDDTLLLARIAAGSAEALELAQRLTDEEPERLLGAARFYLREVMFFEEADAYRVLGLNPGADTALVKQHYRQLQRWLHPDRARQDVAPGSAARVNWAWDQLRTTERRRAYDALLAQPSAGEEHVSGFAGAAANAPAHRARPSEEVSQEAAEARLKAWWLGALGAGCLVLFGFALWQSRMAPPEWEPGRRHAAVDAGAGVGEAAGMRSVDDAGPEGDGSGLTDEARGAPMPLPVAPDDPAVLPSVATATVDDIRPVSLDPAIRAAEATGVQAETAVAAASDDAMPSTSTESRRQEPAPPSAGQIGSAHERLRQMAGFLASPAAVPPPLWNDVATLDSAAEQRVSLHAARVPPAAGLDVRHPQWRMSAERAEVDADYRLEGGDGTLAEGRLHMTLVWREDRWMVSGLRLEPSR